MSEDLICSKCGRRLKPTVKGLECRYCELKYNYRGNLKENPESYLKMNRPSDMEIDTYGNMKFRLFFKGGFHVPTVLDYENENIRNSIEKPDEIIIKDERITMIFTYPLSVEIASKLVKKGGFTRMDLFRYIYEGYKKIYDEEEKEVGEPGQVSEKCLNRARSYGKYGIWGHNLEDLVIESITYFPKKKLVHMFIGS